MSMAFASLTRRREQERLLLERQSFLKDNCRADNVAKWEKRTFDKIEQRNILTTAKKIEEHDEKELEGKRNQLRKLYADDMAEWKAMYNKLQSQWNEDREHQLREKAFKLKEKREQERLEFVQSCYDRQSKKSSEEKRPQSRLKDDRKELVLHDEIQAREKKEKNEQNLNSMQSLEEREINDRLNRKQKNTEMRLALDEQMKILKLNLETEYQTKREEEKALLEKWMLEDALTKRQERDAVDFARSHGNDILKANIDRSEKLNELKALEEERDKLLLEYAMDKEKIEIENDINRKQQIQNACKEYISGLKDQMTKDHKDFELSERSRIKAIEEINKKRDDQLKSHCDDRKLMMLEINKSRLEQICEKERRIKAEKANLDKQNLDNLAQLQRQLDSEEVMRRKKQEMTYQTMLSNKELAHQKSKEPKLF